MKRCMAFLTAAMVFLSVFSGAAWSSAGVAEAMGSPALTEASDPVSINDNEMGWYGLDQYEVDGIGLYPTVETLKKPAVISEPKLTRLEDEDDVAVLWYQHINEGVRTDVKEMTIYKNLAVPVKGGSFSFYYFLSSHYASNCFALEATAYDKEGNAYSMGKPFDNIGLIWGMGDGAVINDNPALDNGWNHYTGVMPEDVAIYKMSIRVYVRENYVPEGSQLNSIPNAAWGSVDYSIIDQIEFIDTQYADSIIPVDADGWVASNNFGVSKVSYNPAVTNNCIDSAESVCLYNLGTGAEFTSSMTKTLASPLQGGIFNFKVFSLFNNYGGDPRYYKASAYVIDTNGKEIYVGGSGQSSLRFSGNSLDQKTYNGWNAFTVDIPSHVVYKSVKIEIHDYNFQSGDSRFYIDGMNFIGATENPLIIDDNEMGWYGLDQYELAQGSGLYPTVETFKKPAVINEPKVTRVKDEDDIAVLWYQHINDSVRQNVKEMTIYKDLAMPVTGGGFSFYYFLSNQYSAYSFGLEAIAYDKEGNAYSMGKPFDNSGLLDGMKDNFVINTDPALDSGWNHYEGILPEDVAVYKMAIRVYVRENYEPSYPIYNSIPNPAWGGVDYSLVDQIEFIGTKYADSIVPLNASGWTASNNFGVSTVAYDPAVTNNCIDSAESVYLYNLGTGAEFASSITKTLASPLQGGTFNFKVYSIFNNFAGDPRYYKASAYVIDTNGKEIYVGGSGQSTFRFTGNGSAQITYNGWNAFTATIPGNIVYKAVKIEIHDYNFQSGDSKFYIDGMNLIGAMENPLIINDSELGWSGDADDKYYVGENGEYLMEHTRICNGPTPQPTAGSSVRNINDDSDNRAIVWMQHINDAPERQSEMTIYKDLTEPVVGGTFSFYYWLSNYYSNLGFGLEAIAYDKEGNAYSLGKPFDNTGVQWSIADGFVLNPALSYGWTHYEGAMPEGVAVYKMAIRVYVRDGYQPPQYFYASIPNPSWPDQNYSLVDQIEFIGGEYALESIDLGKTGWEASENFEITAYTPITATLDGESSMRISNTNGTPSSDCSMVKMLDEPRQGGTLSFKVFNGFLSNPDPRYYMVKAYAIDMKGNRVYIGGSPENTEMKFSGNIGEGKMYYGWNYFLCDIPDILAYQGVAIEFYDFAQYPSGDTWFCVSETLLLDSDVQKEGSNELALTEGSELEQNLFEDDGVKYLDLPAETLIVDLLAEFENEEYVTVGKIATGQIIKLYIGGVIIDEILIVVRGDVDGDGLIISNDMVAVKKTVLLPETLSGAYYHAACFTGGTVPNSLDIVGIKKQILGIGV